MNKLLLPLKIPLCIIAGTFLVLFLAKNLLVLPWHRYLVMILKGMSIMVFLLVCVPFLLLLCSMDCFAGRRAEVNHG